MTSNNNTLQVLNLLIKELKIRVTRQSIEDELKKHPEPNSLLAISETLDNWNIPNAAYSVTTDELIETEIPLPLIACFKNGEFVLIDKIEKEQISIINFNSKNSHVSLEEFNKNYQGEILAFEKDNDSGEPNYAAKRRKEIIENLRTPFVVSGLSIVFIIFLLLNQSFQHTFSWILALLIILKTTGLAISVLLLTQSIDADNHLIQKFCGNDNTKNCNAILQSQAAKVTDELSWSEIGFFYFSGSWLSLFLNNGNNGLITLLAVINVLSLPFTFYSIYYQWRLAKQWCFFCCAVQGLLWLEFFVYLSFSPKLGESPEPKDFALLFACMLIPLIIWVFIKPHLLMSKHVQQLKQQLRRFKYNAELFRRLLNDEVKYNLPDDNDTLLTGNHNAENVITIISNPFCNPCAKTHQLLDEWLNGRNDIKLQTVFYTTIKNEDKKLIVANYLMSLQVEYNRITVNQALNYWYREKNFESLMKKYPLNELQNSQEKLEKQRLWFNLVGATVTPLIFINGRKLPALYQPEDIKYLI